MGWLTGIICFVAGFGFGYLTEKIERVLRKRHSNWFDLFDGIVAVFLLGAKEEEQKVFKKE